MCAKRKKFLTNTFYLCVQIFLNGRLLLIDFSNVAIISLVVHRNKLSLDTYLFRMVKRRHSARELMF